MSPIHAGTNQGSLALELLLFFHFYDKVWCQKASVFWDRLESQEAINQTELDWFMLVLIKSIKYKSFCLYGALLVTETIKALAKLLLKSVDVFISNMQRDICVSLYYSCTTSQSSTRRLDHVWPVYGHVWFWVKQDRKFRQFSKETAVNWTLNTETDLED